MLRPPDQRIIPPIVSQANLSQGQPWQIMPGLALRLHVFACEGTACGHSHQGPVPNTPPSQDACEDTPTSPTHTQCSLAFDAHLKIFLKRRGVPGELTLLVRVPDGHSAFAVRKIVA